MLVGFLVCFMFAVCCCLFLEGRYGFVYFVLWVCGLIFTNCLFCLFMLLLGGCGGKFCLGFDCWCCVGMVGLVGYGGLLGRARLAV